MKGYGKRITYYRKKANMSQKELGEKLDGVSRSYISKLENEKTPLSVETLGKIAEILNVSPGDLIDNEKIPATGKLKEAGAKWIVLGKRLEKQGITPEQVEQWAKIVKHYESND